MNLTQMSNEAILEELGGRLQRVRLNRNLTQDALAKQAGISRRALQKAEDGGVTTVETLVNILRGLAELPQLEQFLPEPSLSPVQMAKLQGATRRRASKKRTPAPPPNAWKWKE